MDLPFPESRYDWFTYEPEGHLTEYGGIDHSIEFVFVPVASWSSRLRMELQADMLKSGRVYEWGEFIGEAAAYEHVTLIRQVANLAVYGVPPGSPYFDAVEDPFDYDKNREWPFMILNSKLVREGLEWLWLTFACRLNDRARHVASEEGTPALRRFCDAIADRFDVQQQWTPERAGAYTKEEVDAAAERNEAMTPGEMKEKALQKAMEAISSNGISSALSSIQRGTNYELWPVMNRAGINGRMPADWNGWEKEAWLRFVEEVDKVRQRFADVARRADAYLASEASEFYQTAYSEDGGAEPRTATVGIGGYHAPDYAERLTDAFEQDPKRFLRRARFKLLRDAAELGERQERTVKEQIGYVGDNARGFAHFVRLLYEAQGRTAPIPLPEE